MAKITTQLKVLGAATLLSIASVSQGAINPFSDDFEGYGVAGVPNMGVTTFAPWFGFSDNGGFPGGYTFTPSINGPQISALGYNGTDNQYWNVYANYENQNVHDRVNCSPCSPNLQENIFVYYQQTFTSADTAAGETWVYSFDYREADVPPAGNSEVGAYIRVFDPIFNVLFEATLDTSGSSTWQEGRLSVTLDPVWASGFIQIGFFNSVQEYEDSGMFYDNVKFVKAQPAAARFQGQGFGGYFNTLHAHHNTTSITPFLDDLVRVDIYGWDTGVGDPADLDATQVDTNTVRFGPGIGKVAAGQSQNVILDVDSDGLSDSRFLFRMSDSGFACGDTSGTVTGELITGETFAAVDSFFSNCTAQCH